MVTISRRTLLQLATAGPAAALLISEIPAQATTGIANLPPGEATPGAIANYLKKTQVSGMARLAEIQTEYRNATAIFPLVLPDGWTFPPDSGLSDPTPGAFWERGMGVSAAYLNWQRAVAAAAYAGYQKGDSKTTKHYLDLLEAGYDTDVRRAAIADPDEKFTGGHSDGTGSGSEGPLKAARNGDFALLRQFTDPH